MSSRSPRCPLRNPARRSPLAEESPTKSVSRLYAGNNLDRGKFAGTAGGFFREAQYRTQRADHPKGIVVQAWKEGILRELLAEDRAFTLPIAGDPSQVEVSLGVGKRLQNLGVAALEGLFLSPLIWLAEIPMSLWSFEIETQFWTGLDKRVALGL